MIYLVVVQGIIIMCLLYKVHRIEIYIQHQIKYNIVVKDFLGSQTNINSSIADFVSTVTKVTPEAKA